MYVAQGSKDSLPTFFGSFLGESNSQEHGEEQFQLANIMITDLYPHAFTYYQGPDEDEDCDESVSDDGKFMSDED